MVMLRPLVDFLLRVFRRLFPPLPRDLVLSRIPVRCSTSWAQTHSSVSITTIITFNNNNSSSSSNYNSMHTITIITNTILALEFMARSNLRRSPFRNRTRSSSLVLKAKQAVGVPRSSPAVGGCMRGVRLWRLSDSQRLRKLVTSWVTGLQCK